MNTFTAFSRTGFTCVPSSCACRKDTFQISNNIAATKVLFSLIILVFILPEQPEPDQNYEEIPASQMPGNAAGDTLKKIQKFSGNKATRLRKKVLE
jgi:hypothetical protein